MSNAYQKALNGQRLDFNIQPLHPDFMSITGPDGRVQDAYRYNPELLGPSNWAELAKQRQAIEQEQMLDNSTTAANTGMITARNNLAMRGGMGGGARERIAYGGARDAQMAAQAVRGQGMLDRANIDLQQEQFTQDINRFNTGLQNEAQQYNIGNAITDVGGQNQHNLSRYAEAMKGYAAKQTADAQRASKGSK